MQLQKGQQLNHGKYTIQRVLGQGGFGITYLAITKESEKVAVKEFFMKDACVRDADTMRVSVPSEGAKADVERYRLKFIKEANNLIRLRHPNIVQVYEVFEENGTNYYAMQYMEGGSLRDTVMRFGPLDEKTAKDYILQVASALRYMHERKHLCHYDVKPGNILIDDEGQAMLIDFGLSKNYDGSGQQTSSTPVGISAGYAPIEQYRQALQEFSPATDVYALGATLYFLVTGQNPPEASIVLEQGLNRPDNISDDTWTVITKAMQPVRQQRYASVAEMIRALEYGAGANDAQTDSSQTVVQTNDPVKPQPTPQPTPQPEPQPTPKPEPATGGNKTALYSLLGLLAAAAVVLAIILLKGGSNKTEAPAEWYDTTAVDSAAYDEDDYNYDTAAVETYEDTAYDEVVEDNPIDVTNCYNLSGNFIIKGKSYPVRLSFCERYGDVISCEYINVSQGGLKMEMSGTINGTTYTFQGHDGSNPLVITIRETRSGHYEGTASGQFQATAVFDRY